MAAILDFWVSEIDDFRWNGEFSSVRGGHSFRLNNANIYIFGKLSSRRMLICHFYKPTYLIFTMMSSWNWKTSILWDSKWLPQDASNQKFFFSCCKVRLLVYCSTTASACFKKEYNKNLCTNMDTSSIIECIEILYNIGIYGKLHKLKC